MGFEKTTGSSETRRSPYERFGSLLCEFRLTSGRALEDDVSDAGDTRGRVLLDESRHEVAGFLAQVRAFGFELDVATFRRIEAGCELPPQAGRFVNAVAVCLGLSEAEQRLLLRVLAEDILVDELGSDLAAQVLGRGDHEHPEE